MESLMLVIIHSLWLRQVELGECLWESFKEVRREFRELLRAEKHNLGGRAKEEGLYMPQPERRRNRERMPWDSVLGVLP